MARIRTVKPEFWDHPKVARVCRDARLFFLGLLNEADDEGRLRYSAKRLAGVLFGSDDDVGPAEIDGWTAELVRERLVQHYEVDGAALLFVIGFTEHQRVSHPTPSRLPDPPETFANDSGATPEPLAQPPESFVPEGKGKEGKGTLAPAERARKRDLLFEAVCTVCGINADELTTTGRGPVNKAVGDLRALGVRPGDVHSRFSELQRRYPTLKLTPTALAKHWASLGNGTTRHAEPAEELSTEERRQQMTVLGIT